MPKYRKKPIVIEAVQYAGQGNLGSGPDVPVWIWAALESKVLRFTNCGDPLLVTTPEGTLEVSVGDWIIQGVKGELYPCKPDIFAATYDPV